MGLQQRSHTVHPLTALVAGAQATPSRDPAHRRRTLKAAQQGVQSCSEWRGRLSLISITSLSCVRGLYSGWRTNFEDMMCCSVSSGSHMLCSPSRTSKSDLENEFKDTWGSSGCDFPTPVVMNSSVEFLTLVCSVQQRAPTHQTGESLHRSCSP